jgi:hypothetical protein
MKCEEIEDDPDTTTTSVNEKSLNSLPPELLFEIFKHISYTELKDVRLVSKQFNQIIMETSEINKRVELRFSKTAFMDEKRAPKIKKFYFTECDDSDFSRFKHNFAGRLDSIESIVVGFENEFNFSTLADILTSCKSLKNFACDYDLFNDIKRDSVHPEMSLSLDRLSLRYTSELTGYFKNSKIRSFSLHRYTPMDRKNIIRFLVEIV